MAAHKSRCQKPDSGDRKAERRAHGRSEDGRENKQESPAATTLDGCGYLLWFGKTPECCRLGGRVPKERMNRGWRRTEGGDEVRESEGKWIRHFFLWDGRKQQGTKLGKNLRWKQSKYRMLLQSL